ncbi:outer spore coat protein CotE [Desulfallas sp. Bu1-1]|uniref:outer spore coat protein CotE n=1 Tax=Desulfallas sp. Bu1-1 TaxID=2787620 RepID=UPI0018A12076|nr:outer spore coat protein CotE [Desulfallas sp. Bu1-1]MBF7083757.1 outer spore coat protein CotE [Desulfallas sp. Bu1-1]
MLQMEPEKYREIITKAVYGNVQKTFQVKKLIKLPDGQLPAQVLGATVTTCQITADTRLDETPARREPGVAIGGFFAAHVWYACNNGKTTAVLKEAVKVREFIPVDQFGGSARPVEAKVELAKDPEFVEATIIDNDKILIKVELNIRSQIICESRVWVCTYQPAEGRDGS